MFEAKDSGRPAMRESPMLRRPIIQEPRGLQPRKILPGLLLSAVFLGLLAGVADRIVPPGVTTNFLSLIGLPLDRPDNLSEQERAALRNAFIARGPIETPRVRLSELDRAIAGMALQGDQEAALRGDIALAIRMTAKPGAARVADAIAAGRSGTPADTNALLNGAAAAPSPQPAPSPAAGGDGGATVAPSGAVAPPPVAVRPPAPRPATPAALPAPAVAALPAASSAVPSPAALLDSEFELPMAWLTIWDHRDEDGDIIRVVSEGYTRTVPILNTPVTLAVPVPASGVVNIVGVHDGFGGITVGIKSSVTPVLLPVLAPGQVVGVPIAPR